MKLLKYYTPSISGLIWGIALMVAFLGPSGHLWAEGVRPDSPQMRAIEVQALCTAFAGFRTRCPKADLRHYSVEIQTKEGNFDVAFVPDRLSSEKFLLGPQFFYGAIIHFVVAKDGKNILRMEFQK